ncbi:MAG: cell division protein ZapA [Variovorax sp.]|nr:cell division protein ZapA [Variovorax sp.]
MKQLEVQIMGQGYLLGCPEGGEAPLREAVKRVDTTMCRIRDAGKGKVRERIAVLAALNMAFDLVRQEAAVAAASASMPAPGEMAVAPGPDGNGADPTRIAQLLQRLDQVLAGDGHLL